MKKLFALVFALMLFVLPAMAEEANVLTYAHPTQGFSVSYPDAWLAVDKANVDDLIAQYNGGTMTFTGTNAATLAGLKAQLASQDCVALLDPYGNNLIVAKSDLGMELDAAFFSALLVPTIVAQLEQQLPGVEIMQEGEIVNINGRDFITVSGKFAQAGIEIQMVQYYYLEGTAMYVFNITTTNMMGDAYITDYLNTTMTVVSTFQTGN